MSSETKEFVRGWFSWRRLKKKKMFDGRDKGGGGGGNIETLGNKGWGWGVMPVAMVVVVVYWRGGDVELS